MKNLFTSHGIHNGSKYSSGIAEASSIDNIKTKNVEIQADKWIYYYTYYTLSDGWYEKWHRNDNSISNRSYKIETYNSSGKLVRTYLN